MPDRRDRGGAALPTVTTTTPQVDDQQQAPAAAQPSPSSSSPPLSIVDNCGAYTAHCGYCSAPGDTAASVGMWAHALAPATYNALVDAGWRRSGRWVYRPLPTAAVVGGSGRDDEDGAGEEDDEPSHPPCCVAHTIRLDVGQVKLTKAQRRCRNRMAAFLAGGPLPPPPGGVVGGEAAAAAAVAAAAWSAAASGGAPGLVLPLPRVAGAGGGRGGRGGAGGAGGRGGRGGLVAASSPRCPSPRGVSPVVAAGRAAAASGDFAWPPTSSRLDAWDAEEGEPPAARVVAGWAGDQPKTAAEEAEEEEGRPVDAAALAARLLREALPASAMAGGQAMGSDRKRKAGGPAGGRPAPPGARVGAREALEAALEAAVAAAAAGSPPRRPLPLAPPRPAAARKLPPTVALTCPAGFVLAAAAAAAARTKQEDPATATATTSTPAALATAVADALNAGGALPPGWSAMADAGHVNLHAPDAATAAAERAGEAAAGASAGAKSPPPPPPAASQPPRAVRSRRSWPSLADAVATSPQRGRQAAAASAPPPPPEEGPLAAQPTPGHPHTLDVRTLPLPRPSPADTEALVAAEFPLFARYQASQHGDDPASLSHAAFKRFLVDTPLVREEEEGMGGGRPATAPSPASLPPASPYLGSAHQQYWLDGVLVAVGVVDILPRGLSSVYFFWEPGLGGLGLGRWSALQEVAWAQARRRAGPPSTPFRFYYMGFYIHTCPKMRYKAEFAPSELLAVGDGEATREGAGAGSASCTTWPPPPPVWVPAADGVPLLDAHPRSDLRVLGGRDVAPVLPAAGPPLAPLPAVLRTLVFNSAQQGGGDGEGPPPRALRPPAGRVSRLGALAGSGAIARPALAALVDRLRPWVAAIVAAGVEGEVVVLV